MESTTIEPKKITPNSVIIDILKSINVGSNDLAYKAAEDYCKYLKGNTLYLVDTLLKQRPRKFIELNKLPADLKKLINTSIPDSENVFLNNVTQSLIDELLIEWKNTDVFKHHNISVRNKILFHGPTGNGKTTLARHIAKLASLPFVEVNSDNIVDSKIGHTSQNINQLFNQLKEPCILFWDEVDTIGRLRGSSNDSAAGMENERMVNSILVNIEKLSNDVIFIGATNRRGVLDTAFLRRFDIQFEIAHPRNEEKFSFLSQMMDYYKLPDELIKSIDFTTLNSYSEIKLRLLDIARKYILTNLKATTI